MSSAPVEQSHANEAGAPAIDARPERARRAPTWALALIGALAAPWLYLGAQRVVPLVRARFPGGGVDARSFAVATRATWIERGFVEMVPPLRLPSRADASEQIEVWVKFPARGRLGARWLENQKRFSLTYPAGMIADRIEFLDGVHIVDVRGTDLGEDGVERFHVDRPKGAGLAGFSWKRDDAGAQAEATWLLLASSTSSPHENESLRVNNACAPCHEHTREVRRGSVPARATDTVGWFVPESVLRDRAPVERHRPREMNVDDGFIRFECPPTAGDDPAPAAAVVTKRDATRWPSCPGDLTPVGVIDVAAALAAGDRHAKQLCASRAELYAHMDDEARRAFGEAFEVCGIR